MSSPRNPSTLRVYRRSLSEARDFWPHLGAILALGLLETPLVLVAPLPMKVIVDSVVGGAPPPAWLDPARFGLPAEALFPLAVGLVVALAVAALGHRLGDWLFREWVAERLIHGFRVKLFRKLLELSGQGRDAAASQDLAYRVQNDATAVQWTAIYGAIPVIHSFAALAGTFAVTWTLSPKLALVALATAVPMVCLVHWNQKRLKHRWHAVKECDSAAGSVLQEVLGGLRIITAFGQEARETERYAAATRTAYRTKLGVIRYQGGIDVLLGLVTALGTSLILALGTMDVMARHLTVGELILAMTYAAQLYGPLNAIGTHVSAQQQAVASAERAFALLDAAPAVREKPDAQRIARAQGRIEFRGIAFGHEGREPVLNGVDLSIPAGASVGIIGRTGSGKSTLVNLLLRLFDPTEGRILLDGIDLRDLKLADLRAQFSVVTQDPLLFSTSIAENIAYGRPGASRAEIVAAAKAAEAHDFIMRLPQGYDTPVGERGARLSGGERQRITMARAFLKDAPILILDEPTSAVDNETEARLVESIERLMQGRTTFMVAHRLGTLRRADLILRLDQGRVHVAPRLVEPPASVAA
jgi:ATP-binding cassette subfamily B protein